MRITGQGLHVYAGFGDLAPFLMSQEFEERKKNYLFKFHSFFLSFLSVNVSFLTPCVSCVFASLFL